MHMVAIGFWGAFFGAVALMLTGALAAFVQSHHRVALAAALTSLLSALFVVALVGWLPISDRALESRLLAHLVMFTAIVLGLALLTELGQLREPGATRRVGLRMLSLATAGLGAGWLLEPNQALALSSMVALGSGFAGLLVAIRSAVRGDRLAWIAVSGVFFMLVALGGLSWIALNRPGVAWQLHALSAVAAMAYLTCIGAMLWLRYSYLIELREVLVQGPRYDPVTRMQSNAAIGHMVNHAFLRQQHHPGRPLVLIAISIGNFYALENLHGRAALNHALFVCAGRLRRCVPGDMEMGRLFEDGFLLVARDATDLDRMVKLGRLLAKRMARPVVLNTDTGNGEAGQTAWAAQVGVGLLVTTVAANPTAAIGMVRDMSRTAWSYSSRVAWHDLSSGHIAELPAFDPA